MTPSEIIASPYTIWIAPVDTAFPAVNAAPGSAWTKIGTSGDRSYSENGVTGRHIRRNETTQPAGSTSPTYSFTSGEEYRVAAELFDLSLEQYAHALGQNAIVATSALPGLPGTKVIGLSMRARSEDVFAIMVRGPSPYGETLRAQFELPRCREAGTGPQVRLRRGVPAALAIEFVALEDPNAVSEDQLFGRLVAQTADELARSGTSPNLYSFAGTGYRWPVVGQAATETFFASEWYHHTPDYETTDIRFNCPAFWSPTAGGEVAIATGESITIQGVSIEVSPGVWVACDGAAETGVATVDENNLNALLPRVQATLAANTAYRCRIAGFFSSAGLVVPRNTLAPGGGAPGGQSRREGAATTLFDRLSATGSNLANNSGAVYYVPSFPVAKGGDGRPAELVVGDSIGHGGNDTQAEAAWTARNAVGYVERGLDDNGEGLRIASHIMCIPGQRPVGAFGWDNPANWSGKIAALQGVFNANGDWPFDEILNQHITNSIPYSGTLRTDMDTYFDLLASTFGKPVYQIEGLPATSSSDGFATVANQTPTSGYAAAGATQGHLWAFNADVGGADGLGDAAAYYRASGKIAGSIAPWRLTSADTTTGRDKWAVRPFATTLASAYASGNDIILTAAPDIGAAINMNQNTGGFGTLRTVTAVSGTGPFTVTLSGAPGTAANAGNAVQEAWGDGIHPSGTVHAVLAQSIIDYKVTRGWASPLIVPAFTSSSISGTPEDGQILTANAVVTGNPAPTLAYQWQKAGVNISGEASQTITLNAGTMSLTDADIISCEITATNSVASAVAEPTIAFVGASGAVPTFLATINASSESGYFDMTAAVINGSGRFEATDDNGGAVFTTVGTSVNPNIDGTLGAVYPDGTTLITRAQAAGLYTLVFTMTKAAGVGDAADAFMFGNDTRIRSGQTTALTVPVEVDGVSITTEDALYTALNDAAEHTIAVPGFDRSAALDIDIGRSGSGFLGSVRRVAIISETDAGGNLATWKAEAIAAVEAA